MDFRKLGAIGILLTMVAGFITEARLQVVENRESIIRLEEREKSLKEHIIEMKKDLKEVKDHLLRGRNGRQ